MTFLTFLPPIKDEETLRLELPDSETHPEAVLLLKSAKIAFKPLVQHVIFIFGLYCLFYGCFMCSCFITVWLDVCIICLLVSGFICYCLVFYVMLVSSLREIPIN